MTIHDPIAQPRWLALVALTIVAVGSLSGCGLAFSDPDATDPAPATSSQESPDATPEQSDPAASEPEASEPEDAAPGASNPARDDLIARAAQTIPCSPGLDVTTDGGIVRVEGACDDLTVSADAAIVIADDVAVLTVSGSGTYVSTLALGDLRLTGDVNEVRWTGATPAVTDSGTANTIGQEQ